MTEKISRHLLNTVNTFSDEKIGVIVYLTRKNALNGFEIVKEYPFINAVGVKIAAHELNRLASFKAVKFVTSSSKVFALSGGDDENETSVFQNRFSMTGKGVGIAILDTGVSPHIDFCLPENRLSVFKDIVSGNPDFYDDNGHGTFVAGVAAGNGVTSAGEFSGVARRASVIGVKVIGADGEGSAFDVLDGMQWIVDNKDEIGVKVCCMSFGATPTDNSDPLRRGAEVLVREGITVVVASGNEGINALKTPAISPFVLSVGAIKNDDKVAEFTSRGLAFGRRKPEVYARGVDVVSVAANSTYRKMSGTSVSAPYVAGACCLLLEKYPSAPPWRIKEMILSSSKVTPDGFFALDLNK